MYPVAYLPKKTGIFTSYKEIETADSAGYNGTQQEQIADLLKTNRSLVESNRRLLEQTDALQQKIQELLSQIAWLKHQFFGQRSKKVAVLNPNQLSLFDSVPATGQGENIREKDSSTTSPSK